MCKKEVHCPDAGEADLTARQQSVLARAWALGYFAVPRRITLTRLAKVTEQSPPALGKMLRRAEGHLVVRYLATNTSSRLLADGSESDG